MLSEFVYVMVKISLKSKMYLFLGGTLQDTVVVSPSTFKESEAWFRTQFYFLLFLHGS